MFKSFTYRSSTISYRIIGEGKPVIFLHGFGEDGNVWKHQINFLQQYFKLIIPDLPGSGQSEMIADMSIEGMAEVIKEIIVNETLNSSSAVQCWTIIGHSMGGYITLALAEKYPVLISSFGLFHSTAFADNEEKKQIRLKAIDFIAKNGSYDFLRTSTPGLFTPEYLEQKKERVDELIAAGQQFLPEALIAYYKAMMDRPDRTNILKHFNGSILFISGLHDKAVPFQQSMQQVHLPAIAHIHVLRNSAHMGMWEEVEKANKALFAFLNEV